MNLLLCEWQASRNTCPVHISLSLACVSLMTYLHCTALCLQTCVPAVAEAKPCSTVCVKLGDQQSWAQACCQSAGSKPPLWSVGGRFVEGRNFLCWVRTTPLEGRTTFCGGSEPSLLGRNRPCGRSEHVLWRVGTLSAGSEPALWRVGTRFVEGRNPLCWVGITPVAGRNTFCGGSEPHPIWLIYY